MAAKTRRIFLGWMVVKRFNLLVLPSPRSEKAGLLGADCAAWRVLNGTGGCFNCSMWEGTAAEDNSKYKSTYTK